MGVMTIGELKPSISGRRSLRPSSSVRHHATEWPISDVSSDLTIDVGKTTFSLHKFPLVSRCGRIRKLLLDTRDSKPARISFHDLPGGPEAFELAAKFCYGVHIEINPTNIATLKCTAHYLEMTEELSEKNLEFRAETCLKDAILPDIRTSISVLHRCEALRPVSEEINLVSRLINAIANNVCKEQLTSGLLKLDHNFSTKPVVEEPEPETTAGWWGKSLTVLKLDFFQRVVTAVKSRGLKQEMVTKILINYAQESIHGLGVRDPHSARTLLDPEILRRQRVTVESITGLLPTQSRKSLVPMVFLSSLLKTAVAVSASASCRSDLEKRIGLQLEQAILEDILIPVQSGPQGNFPTGGPLYDTDSVVRIYSVFLHTDDEERNDMEFGLIHSPGSPKQNSILKVSKLLDSYLAEVALDSNLQTSKFIALAELLPDHARGVIDGLYQAVDLYLKVHPNMKDSDRSRLCKTINCQNLSQEACSHAAQNERLPVQMAVQVLYFEQIRMKNAMSNGGAQPNPIFFQGQRSGSGLISPRDNYASVRRENRELKLEVARMRMRLTDLEKDHVSIKQEIGRPGPANKLLRSFTVKWRKLFRASSQSSRSRALGSKASSENGFLCHKRRNHSIS